MPLSSLAAALCAPLLGALLAWTGAAKLASRRLPAQAAGTALPRLVRGPRRATAVLRATGAAEVALAAGLLLAPTHPLPGAGTALLGAGFVGYLALAKRVAPESSCGCAASDQAPISWHSFARAGAVALGGVGAASADTRWWTAVAERPWAAVVFLALGAVALGWLSAGPGRGWRPVLARLRLRMFGNPLAATATAGGDGGPVPVAASVELLERSRAWETAVPLIRSGLLEHWDEDGWRILHYAGARHDAGCDCERPVSVVFALDATADLDRPLGQAIRVSVVDQETERVLTAELLGR
ncbi:MauE/DoxX family redox-associated membrane protein [Streptomyces millisiae]|uniref:Methylamine utilisation protein MauE domain-containing protein n=1 Tax=Streptomyces millisiae TaxID=3075542 RepID=A0ABU2LZE5_9ACTN|nr:MauE/DoxX family redox-associated membrane protein [Streptomyces sp. DSM 44918]MDT0322527.1 hypothetical protein [Streptomyces sp. DSM 44918]